MLHRAVFLHFVEKRKQNIVWYNRDLFFITLSGGSGCDANAKMAAFDGRSGTARKFHGCSDQQTSWINM